MVVVTLYFGYVIIQNLRSQKGRNIYINVQYTTKCPEFGASQ